MIRIHQLLTDNPPYSAEGVTGDFVTEMGIYRRDSTVSSMSWAHGGVAAGADALSGQPQRCPGQRPDQTDGWYVAPTLLTGVRPDATILRQETFGPLALIVFWNHETDLPRWINDTEYGLAASVYAGRLQDALRIAESIDAGMVGVNCGNGV
jgi:acyl-CoA reductase-like NAD-dependent aldehyde dehydrogenase